MKWVKPRFIVVLLLTMLVAETAWAHGHRHGHHHHAHVGVFIGVPLAGSWYYRSPNFYTYPPVATLPSSPQAYIEQNTPQQEAGSWWYYCQNPQGYYPYVKQCTHDWQLVSPQPSNLR